MATQRPVCAACGGEVVPAKFGPSGTVYASTVVRIAVGNRTPPYALAYVDLDDGPRILAHVAGNGASAPPVASRVRLVAPADGDVVVEVMS
ncbi:Zn-ribbon domain-containing OB-fold protein [Aeromicrobium wangtongii]